MKYLNKTCSIDIPEGVTVDIKSKTVTVKGKRGTPFLHMDVLMVGCGDREDQIYRGEDEHG